MERVITMPWRAQTAFLDSGLYIADCWRVKLTPVGTRPDLIFAGGAFLLLAFVVRAIVVNACRPS